MIENGSEDTNIIIKEHEIVNIVNLMNANILHNYVLAILLRIPVITS